MALPIYPPGVCVDHDDPPPVTEGVPLVHSCRRDLLQKVPFQQRLHVEDPGRHVGGGAVDGLSPVIGFFHQLGVGITLPL